MHEKDTIVHSPGRLRTRLIMPFVKMSRPSMTTVSSMARQTRDVVLRSCPSAPAVGRPKDIQQSITLRKSARRKRSLSEVTLAA